jgi:hypothetical protein
VADADARKKLCEDALFAGKYDFAGSQYTKNDDRGIPGAVDSAGGFDLDSIMLYDSYHFSQDQERCAADKNNCPLLKIDKVDGKKTGTSSYFRKFLPSAGDIAWVKSWYPYEKVPVPVALPPNQPPNVSPGPSTPMPTPKPKD